METAVSRGKKPGWRPPFYQRKKKKTRGWTVNAVLMIRNDFFFFFLTNLPASRVSLLLRLGHEELEAVLGVSLQKWVGVRLSNSSAKLLCVDLSNIPCIHLALWATHFTASYSDCLTNPYSISRKNQGLICSRANWGSESLLTTLTLRRHGSGDNTTFFTPESHSSIRHARRTLREGGFVFVSWASASSWWRAQCWPGAHIQATSPLQRHCAWVWQPWECWFHSYTLGCCY